jgi:hypothetical protein
VDGTDEPKRILDEFAVNLVTSEGGLVGSRNGAFRLRFGENGVYRNTIFQVDEKSDGYSVKPSDELLNKGAIVQCVPEKEYTGKIGLFAGRDIVDWTESHQKDTLSGKIDQFVGAFSLLEDNDPPEVSRVSLRYAKERVRVSFRLYDLVAGIEPSAIKIRIDDDVMIGEFDPYARFVHSEEYHPLTKGTHVVTIEVADRMANKRVIHRSLVVSR